MALPLRLTATFDLSAVVFNDMSIRGKGVLLLLSLLSFSGAAGDKGKDFNFFLAGFMLDGGFQRGAVLWFTC